MFLGEYSHALDSKKRIFMPAKYRDELGETFVITKSVDKCLTVYTLPEWEKLKAKLDSLPATKSRQIKRFIFANADDAHCDSQGRVLISAPLRDYAGITDTAVVIGVGSYLEIWAEDEWIKAREAEEAADIAQMMEELDF
ncbi:MAG: division/cell wall cluster transcriptional repressor MraZ [Clostridia bacterium]|nr:division/cell wall cluster transcriptional repressor MraZ [Clostridia bacterium]